jgi:hypothetical protein
MRVSRRIRYSVASRVYHLLTRQWPVPANQNMFLEPGHFYCPLPDLNEIHLQEARLFGTPPAELPCLDLHADSQLQLLPTFAHFYREMPFVGDRQPKLRGYFDNPSFSYLDGIVLYCMLRHLSPRRVIEVGSGYSSCFALDTNERFLGGQAAITFVEPYPDMLLTLLDPSDPARANLLKCKLQDTDLEIFERLEAGDVLFIDSTHVAKLGSDVNHLFFTILPALRAGVVIHLHDIFYPFDYPKEWIYEGRAWNEAYLLHAFLMNNKSFEIVFWNDYMAKFHREELERALPLGLRNTGGSIWLRKV